MKKYIFISLFVSLATVTYAQETSLTLEVIPGKLANQLTKEQMSTVQELTLTGEMYNCDFYTIRDSMKVLEKLDLSKALADSIPINGLSTMQNLLFMDLPAVLKYIGEFAINRNINAITYWNYPTEIERLAFYECTNLQFFYASENNPDCISIDGILFSKDKKKLLRYPAGKSFDDSASYTSYTVPDSIEVIAEGAFMDVYIRELTLPASINRIEDKAFWVHLDVPTGYEYGYALNQLTCLSIQPPVLIGDPFLSQNYTALFVPEGSEKLYSEAPGWKQFHSINGDTSSLIDKKNTNIKYWQENNVLHIQSKAIISEIELIDLYGNILDKYQINASTITTCIPEKWNLNIYMVRITYQNKNTSIIKIIN